MSYDPVAVANEFVDVAIHANNPVTPMKLQKLVYFAYGWYLALTDEKLFTEDVQAWEWGPVIPSVYHAYKKCGNDPITEFANDYDGGRSVLPHDADADAVRALIKRVWDVNGPFTAARLSNATHAPGSPWAKAVSGITGAIPKGVIIDSEVIKRYFKAQAGKQ